MEMDKIEEKLEKNTEDISKLAVSMARLTQITENVEKRHDESMTAVKEIMIGIQKLFEKDITMLKDGLVEAKSDIRTLKHDLNNAFNTINAIPKMNELLTATATKVEGLEGFRDRVTGGAVALKNTAGIWYLLFGGALGILFMWALEKLRGL